ncbi:C69 family dipeptidase [Pediococcus cellicola]|uniref:Dipeptidase n=1 Tax=Pediococcus cellicola TaxID=319652 RepID=A0A0R2J029_9LACO|nr:C69 family dipeptidase [Pediococcus cellicola]KRN67655.1 dipeptidase [Pediococcus cellicola]GEL14355.1 dipeptidase [Pediococcus cellicola]
MTNLANNYSACTSFLAGRLATADGSTLIGRNEDSRSAWPKHFVVHPHREFSETQIFKSTDNGFTLNLPKVAAKYTATPEWTDKYGLFEEEGINEYGVAMSATESAYTNNRALGADPLVADGIGEEAMVTVTLPYVKSAREGVSYLGSIIEKYGTSETNGILFSDVNEVWYMETAAGHQWVAQRIPDDAYAVVANQLSIQEIDFNDADNFMVVAGLQDFVNQNHLNSKRDTFNFREIFGTNDLSDEFYNNPRVWYGQKLLNPSIDQQPQSQHLPFIRRAEKLIQVDDVKQILSSHFQGTPFDPIGIGSKSDKTRYRPISLAKTQESHILQIRPNLPTAIAGIHWLAMGVAAQSIYIPFYAGIKDTPASYKKGISTYQPDSAYWIYKQAGTLVDAHYLEFGPLLEDVQDKTNQQLIQNLHVSDKMALTLGDKALENYLTSQSNQNAALGLQAMQKLIAELITKMTDMSPLNFKQDMNL